MPKKTAPSTLTGHAKEIWESTYESAWDAYDPKTSKADSQEAYSAAVAWGAVKKQYKKSKDGKWVKKSRVFSLRITKARHDPDSGKIRWHAQAANDEFDGDQGEALDPSLFTDFAENYQEVMTAYATGQTPPDFGHGPAQLPILDVSHYSSYLPPETRDMARVGSITKLYRDGRYLHADGYFDDTEIGHLVAKSILADMEGVLRTSVGFWPDWGNIEVRNDRLFFKGGRRRAYLDHIAVTSVPLIRSTTIDAEEEVIMSEAETMAEDALAVLGDESTVAKLEQLIKDDVPQTESMVLRSEEEAEEVEVIEEELLVEEVEAADVDTVEGLPEPEVVVESEVAMEESVEMQTEADTVGADVEEEMQTEAEVVAIIEVEQLPYGGATSFEGAIEYQEAIDEKWRVEDGWWLLKTVIDNILSSNVEDPKAAIATALDQYTAFLESGESLMSEVDDMELDTTEELIEPVEDMAEVVEDEPAIDGVEALGGEVEDLVELPDPVVSEPSEAQPMSNVVVEEGAGLGHGAVKSFGEALDRLGDMDVSVPKKQAAVRELSQIAETEIQRELVSDANVGELVEAAVGQAMSSVETELVQIRELLTQSVPGSPTQTPLRPERKSFRPNIQAAAVTTRAQTFSDVIDRLLG